VGEGARKGAIFGFWTTGSTGAVKQVGAPMQKGRERGEWSKRGKGGSWSTSAIFPMRGRKTGGRDGRHGVQLEKRSRKTNRKERNNIASSPSSFDCWWVDEGGVLIKAFTRKERQPKGRTSTSSVIFRRGKEKM